MIKKELLNEIIKENTIYWQGYFASHKYSFLLGIAFGILISEAIHIK